MERLTSERPLSVPEWLPAELTKNRCVGVLRAGRSPANMPHRPQPPAVQTKNHRRVHAGVLNGYLPGLAEGGLRSSVRRSCPFGRIESSRVDPRTGPTARPALFLCLVPLNLAFPPPRVSVFFSSPFLTLSLEASSPVRHDELLFLEYLPRPPSPEICVIPLGGRGSTPPDPPSVPRE